MLVKEFAIETDLETFYKLFWLNENWYRDFLVNQLEDLQVEIGEWQKLDSNSGNEVSLHMSRKIKSMHPSKVSFPGVPSHAESYKSQELIWTARFKSNSKLVIKELNNFENIPYSDYFNVGTEWIITEHTNLGKDDKDSKGERIALTKCSVSISVSINFHKSTWLRGTIESNTHSEVLAIFGMWHDQAKISLLKANAEKLLQPPATATATKSDAFEKDLKMIVSDIDIDDALLLLEIDGLDGPPVAGEPGDDSGECAMVGESESETGTAYFDCEEGAETRSLRSLRTLQSRHYLRGMMDLPPGGGEALRGGHRRKVNQQTRQQLSAGQVTGHGGGGLHTSSSTSKMAGHRRKGAGGLSLLQYFGVGGGGAAADDDDDDYDGYHASDRSIGSDDRVEDPLDDDGVLLVGDGGGGEKAMDLRATGDSDPRGVAEVPFAPPTSLHELVVTMVDTAFVLAESSVWQVRSFYQTDLRSLFDITPVEVGTRLVRSFLPGWHASTLKKPDLYGPLLALATLPQVILLSLQVSAADDGCSHSAILGNAVVVTLCIWLGLSALYRLLSYVVAPSLTMRCCLSTSGYSLFSWSAAILASVPIEAYEEVGSALLPVVHVPLALPLLLFGLPTAVAQGYIFWEYTPLSTVSLAKSKYYATMMMGVAGGAISGTGGSSGSTGGGRKDASSGSVAGAGNACRRCAAFGYTAVGSCCCACCNVWQSTYLPWLQMLLWRIPKIFAFVLVAGTHYQLLWYVARVFLPGRKRACRLISLMNPVQYADILTQKELVKYTSIVLSGKHKAGHLRGHS